MSAALIELVSKGAQDAYITGDPQVSFFRQNYKRYTNFSVKPERVDYIGTFAANNEVTIPIKSKGDLLSYVWIEASAISNVKTNTDGFFSSDSNPTEFSLYVGGQMVCTLDSLYIQGVHNALYNDTQARSSCAVTTYDVKQNAIGVSGSASADFFVIPFFFSDDWTKSLPLVALRYHEVEIRIKCRPGFTPASRPTVYANYIYLDTDERKFFTDNEHEILFTQTQYQLATKTDTTIDLTYFNHPVKAIHLISGNTSDSKWATNYSFSGASMYINGTALFENMSNVYHHNVVPQMHTNGLTEEVLDSLPLYTWPFCLTMNKTQPTGSLNFSRIDSAKLALANPTGGNSSPIRVYAVNYNVLRIKNGMAGVAFGN